MIRKFHNILRKCIVRDMIFLISLFISHIIYSQECEFIPYMEYSDIEDKLIPCSHSEIINAKKGLYYWEYVEGGYYGYNPQNYLLTNYNSDALIVEDFKDINDELKKVEKIEYLHLSTLGSKIYCDLKKFTNLKILKLDCRFVDSIPDAIGDLKNLKVLILQDISKVKYISSSINSLNTLEVLVINSFDNEYKLPIDFHRLNNIQRLVLKGNSFKNLDSSVFNLKYLHYLNSDIFSKRFFEFNNLKYLYIKHANENDLLGIENLNDLTQLHIKEYVSISLCPSICKLKNLDYLFINGKSTLKDLPEKLTDLKNLRILIIYADNINIIPNSIYDLSNLMYLKMVNFNSKKKFHFDDKVLLCKNLKYLSIKTNSEITFSNYDFKGVKVLLNNLEVNF